MSTDNCPKCGATMIWRGEYGMCDKCDYCTPELDWKRSDPEEVLPVVLHRVRELEQQSRNAAELRTLQREYDKRTNPELEVPDMRDLGQDVAFVCLMFHKQRKQIAEHDNLRDLLRWRDAQTEPPEYPGLYLVLIPGVDGPFPAICRYVDGDWLLFRYHTHWRPIGPMPMEGKKA